MTGRAPEFICMGAAKAGTTWLYEALARSPGYWMPPMKELNYFGHPKRNPRLLERFSSLHHISNAERKEWVSHFLHAEPRDDAWYRDLFSPAGKRLTGDVSPSYTRIGAAGVEHAKRVAPDAKVLMLVRDPLDRDISHLIHIATGNVFGSSKLGAVMDAIAKSLGFSGSAKEQRQRVGRRFQLTRKDAQNMDHLLTILGKLVSRKVCFDDVPEILEKKVTLADLHAARAATAFKEQRKQSGALQRWRETFGENFCAFPYSDLVAGPERLFARITTFLGQKSRPKNRMILHRVSNRNIYRIEGLEELRAELAKECAVERDALRVILDNNLSAEGAN